MRCADPAVRAVSLLASRATATVSAGGASQQCGGVTVWGRSLLVLLGPGPVADLVVDRRGSQAADLNLVQWVAGCESRQAQGCLGLAGQVRRVPVSARRSAALQLWQTHPREQLLDAVAGEGWELAYLDLEAAHWQLPCGVFAVDAADLLAAGRDYVLSSSLPLCEHLNAAHGSLATALAEAPAYFAEVDAEGATLGLRDGAEGFVRLAWPERCANAGEVLATLRRATCRHRDADAA